MKKILLSVAAVMPLAFSVHAVTNMCVEQKDGTIVRYDVENVKQVYYEEAGVTVSGKIGDYTYVDLGLRSGLKWATFNVGATKPEEYGDYFAWGETASKDVYNWDSYKWCEGGPGTQTKYCTESGFGTLDNKDLLESEDDAASVNWGSEWRMPTKEETDELRNACEWVWTNNFNGTGVAGQIGTSKNNGNTIFLPASGRYDGTYFDGASSYGRYWTSSVLGYYPRLASALTIDDEYVSYYEYDRKVGLSVRAVAK